MANLIVLVGIPGSGKSTLAASIVKNRKDIVIVNRDNIRFAQFGTYNTTNSQENLVKKIRDIKISNLLEAGYDVISDDTNLGRNIDGFNKAYGDKHNIEVIFCEDSFDFNLCAKRNSARNRTVPHGVLESMHFNFIETWSRYNEEKFPLINQSGRDCVIVDIDGTVAKMTDRKPYDWDRVGEDIANGEHFEVIRNYLDYFVHSGLYEDPIVVFLSGRDGSCFDETYNWIREHFPELQENSEWCLYMREAGDQRSDFIVKKELYKNNVLPFAKVKMVFDDRYQVCVMWQSIGIPVMKVLQPSKTSMF